MIELIRTGQPLSFRQRLWLTVQLSWPAIMAQLSSILMQYIDAAMVGRLGATTALPSDWFRPVCGSSGAYARRP